MSTFDQEWIRRLVARGSDPEWHELRRLAAGTAGVWLCFRRAEAGLSLPVAAERTGGSIRGLRLLEAGVAVLEDLRGLDGQEPDVTREALCALLAGGDWPLGRVEQVVNLALGGYRDGSQESQAILQTIYRMVFGQMRRPGLRTDGP